MFTLEGFSANKKIRFARCDYRGGRRSRSSDVDCSCRLWIAVDDGSIVKVIKNSKHEVHSHEVMPHLIDYYRLKLRQNQLQDLDLTKVRFAEVCLIAALIGMNLGSRCYRTREFEGIG